MILMGAFEPGIFCDTGTPCAPPGRGLEPALPRQRGPAPPCSASGGGLSLIGRRLPGALRFRARRLFVPKYLSQQWSKASGRGEVGKLRIVKNQGRTEVSFTLNEELASINDIGGKPASVSAPREHPFLLQSVGGQTLTVFTETSVENQSEEKSESGSADKLALEGIVVQRAECRPAASENYMKLKRLQIEESSKPVRLSQQLDKAVTTNYKPVANHQYNIEYEKKKKEDGKRARADKQQVLDMLFSAFEKHQYYNIKDLVDITKQPVIYLKEILREIGIYNVKGTHKNTWELKPEYRHYQGEEKSD
ncbi:PREDICTED: general transcription factor IIF subunit 2 [Ficedula albicollis]|uniref:general transcription factor IIF subunit 2 n=1 Tax=Ficedula albicollis TaxID=59894 RepID=UPI0007AD798B|nr:PREDICTED: general transcription factor IIF subunit 2 [Ficedula albicollis]